MTKDSDRLAISVRALNLWREAPIIGVGLGTFIYLERKNSQRAVTIHTTFLWLLTEAGLIGVGLYAGFAMMCFLTLLRADRGKQADPLATGMLGIGLVFLGASVGTEVMYQRYFWFLLGLALFLPSMSNQSRTSSNLGSFRTEQSGAVSAIGSA